MRVPPIPRSDEELRVRRLGRGVSRRNEPDRVERGGVPVRSSAILKAIQPTKA